MSSSTRAWLRRTLCFLLVVMGPTQVEASWEEIRLTAPDPTTGARFGNSVVVSGDTALVGARFADADEKGDRNGAVYVFTHDGEFWNVRTKLSASDGSTDDMFGHSVALSGDTALVGASGEDGRGAAYVFTRNGDVWSEQAKLIASDIPPFDFRSFGISVTLSGDTALVGAPAPFQPPGTDAAYIFTRSGDIWSEQVKLTPSDGGGGSESDWFGMSVALLGDTALVGAPEFSGDFFKEGAAYVFTRSGETWSEQAKLTASDGGSFDFLGISAALSADTALVGAWGVEGSRGAAYAFARSGEIWTEQAKLIASDGAEPDGFGSAVALSGDTAVIAARSATVNDNFGQGAAYIFSRSKEEWSEQTKLTASDGAASDEFGFGLSVVSTGDTVLVGAPGADSNQGAAYVFTPDGGGVPVLSFDPTSIDFGDVGEGETSSPQSSTLQNTGDADATGLSFSTSGNDFEADTSLCGDTLPVGGSCAVSVTFTPTEPGVSAATLAVSSSEGASADLPLAGNGVGGEAGFIPTALEVDPEPFLADGNGVFEPGELVEVAPAWRNDGLTMEPLAGAASNFQGADGAIYFLALEDAEYGNVEPGATAHCRDTGVCYFLAVNDPPVRPATHWEATFAETLSDDTTQTWSLHIGDSFADVPRTSPFYAAIETLLHHGVTGGCTGTEYCASGTNTRGQMAVFLLKAAEGGDFVPSACVEGEERFLDVPFDSPLCPWIEELAGRQITTGCGGGNYCPGAPVTRDQMAVFLLKAFEGEGYTPSECTGTFTDVTCPSPFAAWVEELAARGITSGCAGDPPAYCPATPVTRAQMAVFVTETFGLTLYGP